MLYSATSHLAKLSSLHFSMSMKAIEMCCDSIQERAQPLAAQLQLHSHMQQQLPQPSPMPLPQPQTTMHRQLLQSTAKPQRLALQLHWQLLQPRLSRLAVRVDNLRALKSVGHAYMSLQTCFAGASAYLIGSLNTQSQIVSILVS